MRTRLLLPATLLAAVALVSGCGGATPGGPEATSAPSASPSASSSPSSTGGASQLTVAYDDGQGKTSTWQLSCDPAGGDHPDPTAACAALTKNAGTALPEVSKDKMCTQQFGGPQTAVLTGTWQGQPVDSQLNRRNGCEIARWNSLTGLLPRVAA